jgi:TRAP-type mannitol/chloroaromatic compound transport system substrate-binding protein
VRIDDETWALIVAAARREGIDASEWMRRAADERLGRS